MLSVTHFLDVSVSLPPTVWNNDKLDYFLSPQDWSETKSGLTSQVSHQCGSFSIKFSV